jgi:hypothetical protein
VPGCISAPKSGQGAISPLAGRLAGRQPVLGDLN